VLAAVVAVLLCFERDDISRPIVGYRGGVVRKLTLQPGWRGTSNLLQGRTSLVGMTVSRQALCDFCPLMPSQSFVIVGLRFRISGAERHEFPTLQTLQSAPWIRNTKTVSEFRSGGRVPSQTGRNDDKSS
jgi:hypothetical protein